MTIETLIYIHNLLTHDADIKNRAYLNESAKRRQWMQNAEEDTDYPEERDYEEAKIACGKANDALNEFEAKKWN